MKKAASLSLLFLCLIFICAGCNTTESSVSGTVKIIGPDNTEIISTQVSVKGSEPTAEQAVIEACKEKKLAYTLQNNMFDNFDSIASTQTDGWILYANSDKPAETGANLIQLEDGFTVEFRYVNYDQVFAQ